MPLVLSVTERTRCPPQVTNTLCETNSGHTKANANGKFRLSLKKKKEKEEELSCHDHNLVVTRRSPGCHKVTTGPSVATSERSSYSGTLWAITWQRK